MKRETQRRLSQRGSRAKYEYRKHGTCTGLGAENYFAAVKYARDQFVVPDMLKAPREK